VSKLRAVLTNKKVIIFMCVCAAVFMALATYFFITVRANLAAMQAPEKAEIWYPPYPDVSPADKDLALVKKGEYLTKMGDCIACHTNTAAKGPSFGGGLAFKTPFGTMYSPNISPDKETGIGKWSDKEFAKAVREGISPAGQYYYPAFPFTYFSKLSDDDIKAIRTYLESVPAVKLVNQANAMMFPFNWRFLQLGWRIMFYSKHPFVSNAEQTPTWNRGAYIIEGLGHCAMCHTPSYSLLTDQLPLAAPIRKYQYSGALAQGYYAPAINKSLLEKVPYDEFSEVFYKDKMIGGGSVIGPMLEVNHDSMMYMSPDDVKSMLTYLRSIDSKKRASPSAGKGGLGQGTYDNYCAGCHTMGAGGAPKYGDASVWNGLLKAGKESIYANAIHGINGMPAKGTCSACTDDEVKNAVDYLLAAATGEVSKPMMTGPKEVKYTLADGKRLYETDCAVCHNTGFKQAPKPGDEMAWNKAIHAGFYATYTTIMQGKAGKHLPHAACDTCSDAEIIAALKYMMQASDAEHDYSLW
jgi:cytochrome c5